VRFGIAPRLHVKLRLLQPKFAYPEYQAAFREGFGKVEFDAIQKSLKHPECLLFGRLRKDCGFDDAKAEMPIPLLEIGLPTYVQLRGDPWLFLVDAYDLFSVLNGNFGNNENFVIFVQGEDKVMHFTQFLHRLVAAFNKNTTDYSKFGGLLAGAAEALLAAREKVVDCASAGLTEEFFQSVRTGEIPVDQEYPKMIDTMSVEELMERLCR
jgi:hypothetical protein